MGSQPQNPESRINLENFRPCAVWLPVFSLCLIGLVCDLWLWHFMVFFLH